MNPSGRHKTELQLRFQDGQMTGDGVDWVGPFTVHGSYDTADGKCEWLKQYTGRHSVVYSGYNEGRGIFGGWRLLRYHGGFRIWPAGMEEEVDTDLDAERDVPEYLDAADATVEESADELVPC